MGINTITALCIQLPVYRCGENWPSQMFSIELQLCNLLDWVPSRFSSNLVPMILDHCFSLILDLGI
jgi:hypothetical protein